LTTKSAHRKTHWLRANGFVLGLCFAVALAFLFPGPGSSKGWLRADLVGNVGIALILFLQGLSLPFDKIKSGAGNWRLHLVVQCFTFVIFPLVGVVFHLVVPLIWRSEPLAVRQGFLYLCVLPSTISTSVVLTSVARGNVAAALFNAALSNLLGVVLTPLLVYLLMQQTGQAAPLGPLMLKVMLLTLAPFFVGALLRNPTKGWVDQHKAWVARISNTFIVFIVYSAFCDSVTEGVWRQYGPGLTAKLLVWVSILFVGMSLLIQLTCRMLRFNREDGIAVYLCSVKKTLAMGVPLAILIFGERTDISLILLPIMLYHPMQIFINGLLASHWGKSAPHETSNPSG